MSKAIDHKDIKIGDRVRRTLIEEYVAEIDGRDYINDDYTYELIERPVTLPTVPGTYSDKEGDIWRLDEDDWWRICDTFGFPNAYAPFTLLRPVAEVAAEFAAELLDFFEREGGGLTTHENDVRLLAAKWAKK